MRRRVWAAELGALVIAHAARPIKDVEIVKGHGTPLWTVPIARNPIALI
jgi:ABC-type phosphate transport system substrate-binding protein